jgi:hypothetical protein
MACRIKRFNFGDTCASLYTVIFLFTAERRFEQPVPKVVIHIDNSVQRL